MLHNVSLLILWRLPTFLIDKTLSLENVHMMQVVTLQSTGEEVVGVSRYITAQMAFHQLHLETPLSSTQIYQNYLSSIVNSAFSFTRVILDGLVNIPVLFHRTANI